MRLNKNHHTNLFSLTPCQCQVNVWNAKITSFFFLRAGGKIWTCEMSLHWLTPWPNIGSVCAACSSWLYVTLTKHYWYMLIYLACDMSPLKYTAHVFRALSSHHLQLKMLPYSQGREKPLTMKEYLLRPNLYSIVLCGKSAKSKTVKIPLQSSGVAGRRYK